MLFRILMPDGKYASGGDHYPMHTSKEGKVWRLASHLKNHFNQFFSGRYSDRLKDIQDVYDGAVVIEYEMVETRRVPVKEWVKEHESKNRIR